MSTLFASYIKINLKISEFKYNICCQVVKLAVALIQHIRIHSFGRGSLMVTGISV